MFEYDGEYAKKYIERTLGSPYTVYKNKAIASIAHDLNLDHVWDLGGNVSGMMKMEGSLRFQLGKRGIGYSSLDLTPAYFNRDFALSLEQREETIYDSLAGVVGDMRQIPLASNSTTGVVCSDVIEHIDCPQRAISEMYRVLRPGGVAVVVVPSLYKLDAIKVPHILQKRFSSHENRLLVTEWVDLLTEGGFSIDTTYSRPLGIASGLLYTSWLNPDYVSIKHNAICEEEFSERAMQFRSVKSLVSAVDGKIDDMVLKTPNALDECGKLFERGDVFGLLAQVEDWYYRAAPLGSQKVHDFVTSFDVGKISVDCMDMLSQAIKQSDAAICDNAFFGNSALLTLKKSA